MFTVTESGRLQNLALLQDIVISEPFGEETKYRVGYMQINGVIKNEYEFDTMEEAEAKKKELIEQLKSM